MSSAPVKRQRTEAEDATVRHPSIWYNDGSIIIQAENTQFRVHWTVLSKHSFFFCGFEGIPQPSDQPTIDGCPIVHLNGSAVDFQYVLEALYDPHFLGRTTLPLAAVGAMIRLGRKYKFKNLLASALERFISQAPTTLAEYDTIFSPGGRYPTRITLEHQDQRFRLQFLKLAQENGILSALPFAHLHAARLEIASLVVDSSTNLDTLRRCLIGRERVMTKQFQPGYPLGWLIQWQGCSDPVCASNRRAEFCHYAERKIVDALHNFDPDRWRGHLCEHCHKYASESNAACRKKMWEELPGIFDLPQRDQLKNSTHACRN